MKFIILILPLILLTVVFNVKSEDGKNNNLNFEETKQNKLKACDNTPKEDGYLGYSDCIYKLANESDKELNLKLLEKKSLLKKENLKDRLVSFEKSQKTWELYKKSQCSFEVVEIDKKGSAYGLGLASCIINQNFHRLEDLDNIDYAP